MSLLETDRLIVRRWAPDDLDPYAAMCALPDVMRYIGDGSVQSRAQCAGSIARFNGENDAGGFGLMALELKQGNQFIGFCGLAVPNFLPEILPAVEIGWRLDPAFWGKGLATEAARAVMAHGFETMGLERIVSVCQIGNVASSKIMKKLGMALDRQTVTPDGGTDVYVYAISRAAHDLSRT